MKRLLMLAIVSAAFATAMAACGEERDGTSEIEQPEPPVQPGSGDAATLLRVNIMVDGRIVTASMENNAAGRDFISRLPLDVVLNDFNSTTEKIFYPNPVISIDGVAHGCAPSPGDIAIYVPWGNVAVFCKKWTYSNDLIKIGHIDGNGVEALSTGGDVRVKFERRQ